MTKYERFIIIDDLPLEERQKLAEKQQQPNFLKKYEDGESFIYELIVQGNSKAVTIESDFEMKSRYKLTFIKYEQTDKLYRFRLYELSYQLKKYTDPVLTQIMELSNLVSEPYKDLDFGVDKNGNIKKLYNADQIHKKWNKTKEYLTYKHPLTSYEIIKVKEKEIANPQLEITNISFMHFMQVYFKQFGRFKDQDQFEAIHQDQFGSGIPFALSITFTKESEEDEVIHRKMQGEMIYDSQVEKELRKATQQLKGEVSYITQADYYSRGVVLKEANFSYRQQIGEGYQIYSHLNLKLVEENKDE